MSYQFTKTTTESSNPYVVYMKYLFTHTSTHPFPDQVDIPNEAWAPFIDMLWTGWGYDAPKKDIIGGIPDTWIKKPEHKVVVAYSSGKDSATTSLLLKKLGWNPILYHISGINRSITSETKVADKFSEVAEIPIVKSHVSYKGKNVVDPAVKNHLILAYIIEYMMENNITKCSTGNFPCMGMKEQPLAYACSDSYDLYKEFEKAVQATFPQFRQMEFFFSMTHEYAYIYENFPEMTKYMQSCVTSDFRRRVIRQSVGKKYGIEIPEGECLSCYKCAYDYLFKMMWGVIPKTPKTKEILLNKVIPALRKKMDNHFDIPMEKAMSMPTKELIDWYIRMDDFQRYYNDKSTINKEIRLWELER